MLVLLRTCMGYEYVHRTYSVSSTYLPHMNKRAFDAACARRRDGASVLFAERSRLVYLLIFLTDMATLGAGWTVVGPADPSLHQHHGVLVLFTRSNHLVCFFLDCLWLSCNPSPSSQTLAPLALFIYVCWLLSPPATLVCCAADKRWSRPSFSGPNRRERSPAKACKTVINTEGPSSSTAKCQHPQQRQWHRW